MTTEQLRAFIVANEGRVMFNMKHKLYDAALIECDGNVSETARMLGVSKKTIQLYITRYTKGLKL